MEEAKSGSELVGAIPPWCYSEQVWEIGSEQATGEMLNVAKCNPAFIF